MKKRNSVWSNLAVLCIGLSFIACKQKVLVDVYGDSDTFNAAYEQFRADMAEQDVDILVAKHFEEADVKIVNGRAAAKEAGYLHIFEAIFAIPHGYIIQSSKVDGKTTIVVGGMDEAGTLAGMKKLQQQLINTKLKHVQTEMGSALDLQ